MNVIVIYSEEKEVAAVVALPVDKTAEEIFRQWVAREAAALDIPADEATDYHELFDYSTDTVLTLD